MLLWIPCKWKSKEIIRDTQSGNGKCLHGTNRIKIKPFLVHISKNLMEILYEKIHHRIEPLINSVQVHYHINIKVKGNFTLICTLTLYVLFFYYFSFSNAFMLSCYLTEVSNDLSSDLTPNCPSVVFPSKFTHVA